MTLIFLMLAILSATLLRNSGLVLVPLAVLVVWKARGWRWALPVAASALPALFWYEFSFLPVRHAPGAARTLTELAGLMLAGLGNLVGWQHVLAGVLVLAALVWAVGEDDAAAFPAAGALALFGFLGVASLFLAIGGHATRQTAILAPLLALVLVRLGHGSSGWKQVALVAALAAGIASGAGFLIRNIGQDAGWFAMTGINLW